MNIDMLNKVFDESVRNLVNQYNITNAIHDQKDNFIQLVEKKKEQQ